MNKYRSYEPIRSFRPEMGSGGGGALFKIVATIAAGGVITKVLFPQYINPHLQEASNFICEHSISISNTLREGAPIIDKITDSPEIVGFMYDAANVLMDLHRVLGCGL